jgi:hypothetical protein
MYFSQGQALSLTRILGVFRANIVITSIKYILVHERRTRRDLSEKRNLDWLANFDSLPLLHEDLASVLAAILAIERWDAVLFGVVALFEGLEGCHEVVPTCNTVCNNALSDTGCNSSLDNGSDRVHGTDDLGLELGWDVEFDLLEEVFGGAETTDDQDILC